jgi:hypothetical protein
MRSQIAKWRTTGTWGPILALKWRTSLEKSRRVALDFERSPYFATASVVAAESELVMRSGGRGALPRH